jgi:DNA helicase II / ATP-dependent DNA helicase PcrA
MVGEIMDQITQHLLNKQHFLLSGGAGSGKTYTLVETLRKIYELDPQARAACITYTNVAAEEVKKRAPFANLWVSTIHEFLWNNIKGFEYNLVEDVKTLIKNNILQYSSQIPMTQLDFKNVEYRNHRNIENGIISHDDLLIVAEYMYNQHPLLCSILADKFQYILIDEYQDTQKQVKQLFLHNISPITVGRLCLGFFGDKMQSIYDTGIVDIQADVDSGDVKEIIKADNYRCSLKVIELLNKIRQDITQSPADKNPDGSIANKKGNITFLHSDSDFSLEVFRNSKFAANWNFDDPKKTKLLFLTHKLIAKRSGWVELQEAFGSNDHMLGPEPDPLATHLLKIGEVIKAFERQDYATVISALSRKIESVKDKHTISSTLESISSDPKQSIGFVIDVLDAKKIIIRHKDFHNYLNGYSTIYDKIKDITISQVLAYYEYYNENTPFSTQHGIKGAEFDNVLVVMDNGRWYKYNFTDYFEGNHRNEDIIKRTERIFYVSCSRAKDNLVVFFKSPSQLVLKQAEAWFGKANVHKLD